MVRTEFRDDGEAARIVLASDDAWSWRTNMPLFLALLLASFFVITITLAMGAWVIPFFSVFEVLMVALAVHVCLRRAGAQEVLTFSKLHLKFERGRRRPEQTIEVQRFFARFAMRYPDSRLGRPQLKLRYRVEGVSYQLSIGKFLTTAELLRVEKAIREIIHRIK